MELLQFQYVCNPSEPCYPIMMGAWNDLETCNGDSNNILLFLYVNIWTNLWTPHWTSLRGPHVFWWVADRKLTAICALLEDMGLEPVKLGIAVTGIVCWFTICSFICGKEQEHFNNPGYIVYNPSSASQIVSWQKRLLYDSVLVQPENPTRPIQVGI